MCNCIQQTNEMLRENNVRLVSTMFRDPDAVVIQTDKIDSKKRGRPPVMLATYCPFCGEKYPHEQKDAA